MSIKTGKEIVEENSNGWDLQMLTWIEQDIDSTLREILAICESIDKPCATDITGNEWIRFSNMVVELREKLKEAK